MDSASEITFILHGLATAYARTGGKGKIRFTPQHQRTAMQSMQQVAAEAMDGRPPLQGPVSLILTFVWPWPKSMTERKRRALGGNFRTARPDADNLAKLVADALNGICYLDDAQVCELRVRKLYGESALTRVVIEPLSGEGGA